MGRPEPRSPQALHSRGATVLRVAGEATNTPSQRLRERRGLGLLSPQSLGSTNNAPYSSLICTVRQIVQIRELTFIYCHTRSWEHTTLGPPPVHAKRASREERGANSSAT